MSPLIARCPAMPIIMLEQLDSPICSLKLDLALEIMKAPLTDAPIICNARYSGL